MKQYYKTIIDWHEKHITSFQRCANLSNYQMMWTAFAKGVLVSWVIFYLIIC